MTQPNKQRACALTSSTLQRVTLVALLLLAPHLGGCATIINGTTQTIPVATEPPGAEVYVDGTIKGHTPVNLQLNRKESYQVRLALSGYPDRNLNMESKMGGGIGGNILFGGLIGVAVDAGTGASRYFSPKAIDWDFVARSEENPNKMKRDARTGTYGPSQ